MKETRVQAYTGTIGGRTALLMAVAWIIAVASCGYTLSGSGQLPGGVNTVAVKMLVNQTAESGLEIVITNYLINEFTRRRANLVAPAASADAVLTGTINSLSSTTVARSGALTAVERLLVVSVSLTLVDRSGKVLWVGPQLSAEYAYAVAQSKSRTETNRRQAIARVSQRLAEYAYERLTDVF